ncbi:hypothetical protein ACFDR9_000585 [Janthinobacterium sp. CG_23.3]|uniref:hypothetical protein n=1 Tax=Janthinobacterium sp. CG_23.3 TaxID=3349634 RepID=UPI0038D3ED5C
MATKSTKSVATWGDVKRRLLGLDQAGLVALVQDLYSANKDNQAFLHTRFGLGENTLASYKKTIERWLWPDVLKNQDTSVAKAKKAITDYKKAIGHPESMAELMVYFCECAAGFSADIGLADERYFDALVRMFDAALTAAAALPADQRDAFISRLGRVRDISQNLDYGVGDEMDDLFEAHGVDE